MKRAKNNHKRNEVCQVERKNISAIVWTPFTFWKKYDLKRIWRNTYSLGL